MYTVGVAAALVSAASWALGSVLWRKVGTGLSAYSMNLVKGLIGSVYLAGALLLTSFEGVDGRAALFLGVSGVVGIAAGDTFFFAALLDIGPRLTSLMGTLTPVCTALVAVAVLGERPELLVWTGIVLTFAGVTWVLVTKSYQDHIVRHKARGVLCGAMSVLCTVIGIILAKKALTDISAIQASFIRMLSGTAGLALWGALRGSLRQWAGPLTDAALLKKLSLIIFLGTFGGFFLSLFALKLIDAAVASSLVSTTPLFVIPVAAVLLGERISVKSVLGTAVAVCGVALIYYGGR